MAKKKVKKKATKKKATKKKTAKAVKKAVKKTAKVAKKATKKVAKKVKSVVKTTAKRAKAVTVDTPKPLVHLGERVPTFELEGTGNKKVALPLGEQKKVVLYFYPKDATPGCTIEGQEFTRLHEEFKKLNTEVYGVSRDSLKSHENFKSNQCYTIDLLSDENEKACGIFGVVKPKNMYGKMVRGIERSTFVIDENGVLVKEWRGVKAPGHAEEVLGFIKGQKSQS